MSESWSEEELAGSSFVSADSAITDLEMTDLDSTLTEETRASEESARASDSDDSSVIYTGRVVKTVQKLNLMPVAQQEVRRDSSHEVPQSKATNPSPTGENLSPTGENLSPTGEKPKRTDETTSPGVRTSERNTDENDNVHLGLE